MTLTTSLLFVGAFACKDQAGTATSPSPAKPAAQPVAEAKPAEAAPAGGAPTADDEKEAKEIFSLRCTPCHGAAGAGDGPASAALTPKPASFASAEWQNGVTDEHIEKIIMYGGAAVGKSAAMPSNPDLASKEGVVKALRAYVRSMKQ